MTYKIYLVTDLGPGDGGKGGAVHKVSSMMNAHTIIKVGGAQGSHGVRTSRGESFAFSQWGCGTFEGVKTHLTPRMVVSPVGLLNEANSLRYEHGIHNAFDLLTVDEDALIATPFHGIASRLKEMARGDNPRGTIGTGVGEAYRDQFRHPELAIRAGDLRKDGIRDRIAAVREQIRLDLEEIVCTDFLKDDSESAEIELDRLQDDGFLDYVVSRFGEVAANVKIVDRSYLGEKILSQDGVAVVESSHGVLTDHFAGFHPHTSAIRTLPCFTHQMLAEAGYGGRIVNLGVTRAYAIRHGAGPMPTTNAAMAEQLLPGSSKENNRFQGEIRVGPLDLVLLRYAIQACGGPTKFDGLAVSWFDQIQANGKWHLCNRYSNANDRDFFDPSGEIRFRQGDDIEQLEYQEALTKRLFECLPEVETTDLPSGADREELYELCSEVVEAGTGVPVRMVSFGPTELDKLCR